jgi:hypothetical protein
MTPLQPDLHHALKPGQTAADRLETAAVDIKAAFCQIEIRFK